MSNAERLLRTHWMDLTDDEREIVREAERQVGHLTWCLGNTPEKACARKLAPVLADLTAAREHIEALESALAEAVECIDDDLRPPVEWSRRVEALLTPTPKETT